MYYLSNKDREELITLLGVLIEREKYIPLSKINMIQRNLSRKGRLMKRKLENKKIIQIEASHKKE